MISKNLQICKKNQIFSKHKVAATDIRGAALLVNYKKFNFSIQFPKLGVYKYVHKT